MTEQIFFYDTTLRDGAQTHGVDFSLEDKKRIAAELDGLGIDYIEGGWPGSNTLDSEFFAQPLALQHAELLAFGMTKRHGTSVDNDPTLNGLTQAVADGFCIVGKTWDFHVTEALNIPLEENLNLIRLSIEHLRRHKRQTMFDAEHFFDGYRSQPDYALQCLESAIQAGASWIILCDTNGGSMPDEIFTIVKTVCDRFPTAHFGIHTHNDRGLAVANALAAVHAGAKQIQGTINGIGERCGNANLLTLAANLAMQGQYRSNVKLQHLTKVSRLLTRILEQPPLVQAPYVGSAAFTHKGGLHAAAVKKNPSTYEHIAPELVGNQRHIVISNQAGSASIAMKAAELGYRPDDIAQHASAVLEAIKHRENQGYSYDRADASLALIIHQIMGHYVAPFQITACRLTADIDPKLAQAECVAELSIAINNDNYDNRDRGIGPVQALNQCFQNLLVPLYPQIAEVTLADFMIRVLMKTKSQRPQTSPLTRVLTGFSNRAGERWRSIGVANDVVAATVAALYDGYCYPIGQTSVVAQAN